MNIRGHISTHTKANKGKVNLYKGKENIVIQRK